MGCLDIEWVNKPQIKRLKSLQPLQRGTGLPTAAKFKARDYRFLAI